MAYDIGNKLVIAVASSALFDLEESDAVFREKGEEAYRAYQREHESDVLAPGMAFSFVRRLLAFNISEEDQPVEVILLSRNDPDTGLRVMNSIEHHKVDISRAAFVKGREPYRYVGAFKASLFLSKNESDVRGAIMRGYPAGLVLDSLLNDNAADDELRIAFDFDGVLADDSAERIFVKDGLKAMHACENANAAEPCEKGPLFELLWKVARLQQIEKKRVANDPSYKPRLRLAIITARNAPAHKRVVATLRDWKIEIDETFFLGGMSKHDILGEFRPHVFFDDTEKNLQLAKDVAPCVHIPYGVQNDGEEKQRQ